MSTKKQSTRCRFGLGHGQLCKNQTTNPNSLCWRHQTTAHPQEHSSIIVPVGDSNSDSAHSTDTGSEQNIQIQIDSCRTHYKHAYDLYNKLWDYEDSIIADLGKQDRYATETEVAKRDELIAEARGGLQSKTNSKNRVIR